MNLTGEENVLVYEALLTQIDILNRRLASLERTKERQDKGVIRSAKSTKELINSTKRSLKVAKKLQEQWFINSFVTTFGGEE